MVQLAGSGLAEQTEDLVLFWPEPIDNDVAHGWRLLFWRYRRVVLDSLQYTALGNEGKPLIRVTGSNG